MADVEEKIAPAKAMSAGSPIELGTQAELQLLTMRKKSCEVESNVGWFGLESLLPHAIEKLQGPL